MRRFMLILLILLLPLSALGEVHLTRETPADWQERPLLRVTFLETGRSDAILVECGGENMLLDGGDSSFAQALKWDLESRGLTSFRYFLNTHPHNDHIEGLTYLIRQGVCPERFMSPFSVDFDGDSYHKDAVKATKKAGVIYRLLRHGDVFDLGGAQLHILRTTEFPSLNDRCAVVLLTFGDSRILLTGDLTGQSQKSLLALAGAEALRAQIVKAPHHGENAFVAEFLTAVAPSLVLCNSMKDEAPAMVSQASGRDLPLLFSGEGEIVLETDGTDWYVWQNGKQGRDRWKTK